MWSSDAHEQWKSAAWSMRQLAKPEPQGKMSAGSLAEQADSNIPIVETVRHSIHFIYSR